ncbi:acid phosphatase [Jeongeupia naejangsanensis]|uniref:Phosphatase PAP2 family protein n=1 Tax=Jeongeupia naejangsanensis TaxID=613195 RepID=A0ABS2BJL6_9NEIS|nr:phosphatase PAP2 family protein [Jeongeupia naejangsanensis]MBM3115803.1 phosphatase PAP2 family protein [Jeongeupia naejangsanensis]
MRLTFAALALLASLGFTPVHAADAQPFITAKDVDLTRFLPAPPANDSAQTKAEIAELLTIQSSRTPAMEAAAKADVVENVWRFADVLGPRFNEAALPAFSDFFARVVETEGAVVDPAKDYWKRPRPHMLNKDIKPVVKLSTSGAWPSGHSTVGYLMATVLASMVPEQRDALFARAAAYAENRIVGGIHYRSDTVMGRTAGALIAQRLFLDADFQAGYGPARAELRAALGL